MARGEVRLRCVDEDDVGLLADLERADLRLEPKSLRAVDRRHAQRLPRRQRLGIAAQPLLQQRRKMHLLEQVQIVVAGSAVRAEAHVDAVREQLLDRRDAVRELQVTAGVVGDGNTAFAQQPLIDGVDVDAVRRDDGTPKQPSSASCCTGVMPCFARLSATSRSVSAT